jgi:glycosyltransferase involved in cell wall biosynthesis
MDHQIDLLTSDTNDHQLLSKLMPVVANFFYFRNHKNFGVLRKFFFYLKTCLLTCVFLFPEHYHTISNLNFRRKLKSLIRLKNYDIILLHYWWMQKVLPRSLGNSTLVIDTHGLLFEKVLLEAKMEKNFFLKNIDTLYARNYKNKELAALNCAHLLVFNSKQDKIKYDTDLGGKVESLAIPNGQDLNYFTSQYFPKSDNTILFYGSLGGLQNQLAFKRFWQNIYPLVLNQNHRVQLIILGNDPPKWIRDLQSEKIKVTGFVDDIRPYIAKSNVCVLSLITGSGFRGRAVEVMAMGVPVVGTHNALDNLDMANGVHGYITDDDKEMADYILELLKNKKLNQEISANCISFIHNNFSIENTYGRLSALIGG